MKIKHISITARDADKLAAFYIAVFGCSYRRPATTLSGERVWRGNGLHNIDIYSIWLALPGSDGPFLELLQYDSWQDCAATVVNAVGYGHIAVAVDDIDITYQAIIDNGGRALGEITNFGTEIAPYRIVYMRDLEGNILEIEQG